MYDNCKMLLGLMIQLVLIPSPLPGSGAALVARRRLLLGPGGGQGSLFTTFFFKLTTFAPSLQNFCGILPRLSAEFCKVSTKKADSAKF